MPRQHALKHRIDRSSAASVRSWEKPAAPIAKRMKSNAVLHMGWGRLIFAHTFEQQQAIAELLRGEQGGQRDVALYLRDPHVVVSLAPQELFLDPSHTFRLWLNEYRFGRARPQGVTIRRIHTAGDIEALNEIYAKRLMVQADPDYLWAHRRSRVMLYVVAEDAETGAILGGCAGADHQLFFHDPENGSSLWSLAVDPQSHHPGVGEALVRYLAEHYQALGRSYLDLSVMHDNAEAVNLYEKLGFRRVPVFCLKRKNTINEALYAPQQEWPSLNPYAQIIVREAQRRGIAVQVVDADESYFILSLGGRSVLCRESLTELTSAIAMSWCDDKRMTARLLRQQGLNVPDQITAHTADEALEFLAQHDRVVVKPARGEQGQGVAVDLTTPEEVQAALERARKVCDQAVVETMVAGMDLRIIVIDFKMIAAAVRKPPAIVGNGTHTVKELIEKLSRRRAAATGGESHIPLDEETHRCVLEAGYDWNKIVPRKGTVQVRKAANLHTGGTIHDVTAEVHPALQAAAEKAARTLNIPVVGLDFLVPDVGQPDYTIIEANERPGLANHEPQPTAERFIDLLFPQTRSL